jgi:heme exporter protein B
MNDFLQNVIEIFKKELKAEFRTKYVLNSLLMFVLISVAIIRFAAGDEKLDEDIATGLLWVVIFFASVSSLARTFIKEQDKDTINALKLSSIPEAVFIGKLMFNLLLSYFTGFLTLLLFVMIMDYQIQNILSYILIFLIGNKGLVISLTIIAAIISKANSKGTLYPVLAFPILIPLLVSIIYASKLAAAGAQIYALLDEFIIMICYIVVVFTVSIMLFKFIWEE